MAYRPYNGEIKSDAARTPRIVFGFEARVGKDTAVDYLIKKHGGIRISFAAPIYEILEYAQGVCDFEKIKDREFLQYIGTEWARKKDPDVWVNVARRRIEQTPPDTPIFISDVRFPNEMAMLKSMGFVLVNITRDSATRLAAFNSEISKRDPKTQVFENTQTIGSTTHASETALRGYDDAWNIKIANNGRLEEFYTALDQLFDKFYQLPTRLPVLNLNPEAKKTADILLEETPRSRTFSKFDPKKGISDPFFTNGCHLCPFCGGAVFGSTCNCYKGWHPGH